MSASYQYVNKKGITYFLNSKEVTLRGGQTYTIYYFSKDERPETASSLPEDKKVVENVRNGLPVLKNVDA